MHHTVHAYWTSLNGFAGGALLHVLCFLCVLVQCEANTTVADVRIGPTKQPVMLLINNQINSQISHKIYYNLFHNHVTDFTFRRNIVKTKVFKSQVTIQLSIKLF